jgi:F0F1-type ATP synthase membrane subunit b/b'
MKMIDKRKAEIKESADLKAKLTEETSLAGKNRNDILVQAKLDARNAAVMIENNAHAEAKEILDKANAEADSIIAKANGYLEDEKVRMQQEMAVKVEAGVHKAMQEIYNMDKKDLDRAMIDKVLKEIA